MKDIVLLLLLLAALGLGYLWHTGTKALADLRDALPVLEGQRNALQKAAAEKAAAKDSDEAVVQDGQDVAKSSVELQAELDALRAERETLAAQWKPREAKLKEWQKARAEAQERAAQQAKAQAKQAAQARAAAEDQAQIEKDLQEARTFIGELHGYYFFATSSGNWHARTSLRGLCRQARAAIGAMDLPVQSTPPEATTTERKAKKRVKHNVQEEGYDVFRSKTVTTQRKYSSNAEDRRAYQRELAAYHRYCRLNAMYKQLSSHPDRIRE